ncbi:antitoxin Xre-like helix-turn-helix domain-containing protein [Polaromonas sp.]|uniref:antitoxin Xre-like helix-turn-helix domain-containing protein n=1 Tax=Polaromonas sp. TaxID=1869339 RepID=UPI0025E2B9E7|nr:antitoxin Xre-like helix-turn-helix domain-containing protein [Polaromonas sp.]
MTTIRINRTPVSAFTLLDGAEVLHARPRTVMDWIPLVRRGLPATSVEAISRLTRTAQSDLVRALAIPERTLARRKREGLLSAEESAKFVRFARVVELAEEVF